MELQVLDATNVTTVEPIEYKGQIVITTNQLAESYETEVKNISNNFNRNKDKFKENKHYVFLQGEELKEFKAIHHLDESLKYASQLYLWTHKGASRHCKILDTDKAWEQFDLLEENYFDRKEEPQCVEDLIIMQAKSLKDLRQQVNQATNHALQAKEEVKTIKEVVSLDTTSWRSETQTLIAKIARKQGDLALIKEFRTESYELLNKRFGVNLEIRLTNKRRRMAEEGISKSKRDKINFLDVIAEDKKLVEGYVAIVKDMSIKYGI